MNIKTLILIATLFFFLTPPSFNAQAQTQMSPEGATECDQLNTWIDILQIEGTDLAHPDWIRHLYKEQDCEPLWYNPVTRLIFANEIISILQNAKLNANYHLEEIEALYGEIDSQLALFGLFDFNSLSDLDVLLTDAALNYAFTIQDDMSPSTPNLEDLDEETKRLLVIDGLRNALKSESLAIYFEELKEGIDDFEISSFEEEPYEEDSSIVSEDIAPIEDGMEGEDTEIIEDTVEAAKTVAPVVSKSNKPAKVDSSLYKLVKEVSRPASKSVFNVALYHPAWIDSFYKHRNYQPVWHNGYTLYGRGSDIVYNIEKAYEEGLNPKDYHGELLSKFHNDFNEVYDVKFIPYDNFLPKIEVLLTDAALHYAHHLQYGKLNPDKLNIGWEIKRDAVENLATLLHNALAEQNVNQFFADRKPQHSIYPQLKKALAHYRSLQKEGKEWDTNLQSDKLELGMEDKAVIELRKRLFFETPSIKQYNGTEEITVEIPKVGVDMDSIRNAFDDIIELEDSLILTRIDSTFNPALFDSTVYRKLVDFQYQHGVSNDGVIGPNTLSVLNVSLQDRINQLLVALERWRWMPNKMEDFYVFINIPAYQLDVYKEGAIDVTKKVMVGKPIHATVTFSNYIRYLELNPYWTVPFSISTNEILPKLKQNLSYLNRQNMKVFSGGKVINPYNVNWSSLSKNKFPYTIRQEPGSNNALGTVKFMFPNKYNIYLHDTPSKSLFVKTERAYSHGCIRLDNPVQFAEYLLKDNPKWDADRIQTVLDGKKNTRVSLDAKIPIYITYFTAWVDAEGLIRFQKDVYSRDEAVMKAM